MPGDYSLIFGLRKICPNPFLSLEVNSDGNVSVCCTSRLKKGYKYVGNILENTLGEIWNGKQIQDFRQIIYDGEYQKICESFCPQFMALKEGKIPPWYSNLCEAEVYREIEKKKVILDSPYKAISIASDGSCNLFCIMCRSERKVQPTELEKRVNNVLYNQILENIDKIRFLELTGNGDPFFNKEIGKFLDLLSEKDISYLTIRFITNAQLLNEKRWEQIKKLKIKALYVNVSIDAATKATYESIRRGGKWETLVKNMEMLAKKRLSGFLDYLSVSFVVMKRNIHEMIPFIYLAKSWNCDRIEFQRIMGDVAGLENIFDIENPKPLKELAEVLKYPIFNDRQLIDVSSFLSYMNYCSTREKRKQYVRKAFRYKMDKFIRRITLNRLLNIYRIFKKMVKINSRKQNNIC